MTKKKLPNVCEEPEPVSRAWAILREELGFLLLHDQRQRVYDVIAHEVAEEIRRERDEADVPGSPVTPNMVRGMTLAADLADPEVQR
ncbi:hypothetical protein O3Q52_36215 [Streptomyces sp. ActVer]|uniref:hypothetical protein n=1 Tax=Streptomyces sp. ActVer TaxID=3014558 RepID=UPI0022B4533D|nr:hypothetical protein [Streptomyces sp. ActVer]MCZ4513500.1 hypothetical protein [Streptomyces sp. ActVer]